MVAVAGRRRSAAHEIAAWLLNAAVPRTSGSAAVGMLTAAGKRKPAFQRVRTLPH
jgi:H+/gluconate symporter-like permease